MAKGRELGHERRRLKRTLGLWKQYRAEGWPFGRSRAERGLETGDETAAAAEGSNWVIRHY
jgi:hypothetical protein